MLTHRHAETQVITAKAGRWQVRLNTGDDEQMIELKPWDTLSVPPGAWRSFTLLEAGLGRAEADGTGELVVINRGDGRVRLEWSDEVVRHALKQGWVLDPNGYRAPAAVMMSATEDD